MKRLERRVSTTRAVEPDAVRDMRSDLRMLVALEWIQTALGIALLAAVLVRSVIVAEDNAEAIALTIAGLLAMVLFTLALRIRMGHESLRRDVQELEIRSRLEARTSEDEASPYRGRCIPREPVPDQRQHRMSGFARRFMTRVRVESAPVETGEHGDRSADGASRAAMRRSA